MNRYLVAAAAIFLFTSTSAWAQEDPECDYNGNQIEMNKCAMDNFEKADKELNRVYKGLKKSLTKQRYEVLLKEQRAWLKDRDPNCKKDADAEAEGGSMWPLVYGFCLENATEARTEQLKKWR